MAREGGGNDEVPVDFRTVYRGGLWWIEHYHEGAWKTFAAGPYKYRRHAEKRIERERKSPEEQKG